LIAARTLLLQAQESLAIRQSEYEQAEARYFAALTGDGKEPRNVVIENIAILPKPEWRDCLRGARCDLVTVDVLTEGT